VALGFCLWNGFWAPKGTPQEVISKLNAAVVNILAGPELRRRLIGLAYEIPPQQTPEPLGALQRAEIEKWWPIIKAANVKAE
jgi:tripartite-type tricarboxylate transporter receptor subunit TctC